MSISIYTDGSARGNGAKDCYGGWGFVVVENQLPIFSTSGNERNTTNNRMELTAILMACHHIAPDAASGNDIIIYTDSAYIANCYKQQWYKNWEYNGWKTSKKTPVKNEDLWKELIPYFKSPRYIIEKVRGHADNEFNNMADMLATSASAEIV